MESNIRRNAQALASELLSLTSLEFSNSDCNFDLKGIGTTGRI